MGACLSTKSSSNGGKQRKPAAATTLPPLTASLFSASANPPLPPPLPPSLPPPKPSPHPSAEHNSQHPLPPQYPRPAQTLPLCSQGTPPSAQHLPPSAQDRPLSANPPRNKPPKAPGGTHPRSLSAGGEEEAGDGGGGRGGERGDRGGGEGGDMDQGAMGQEGVGQGAMVQVAVKQLREESKQGAEEFLREVLVLGRLAHAHLVLLWGYCVDGGAFLVYELMEGGSLDYALIDCAKGELHFSWPMRLKVAVGAKGELHFSWPMRLKVPRASFQLAHAPQGGSRGGRGAGLHAPSVPPPHSSPLLPFSPPRLPPLPGAKGELHFSWPMRLKDYSAKLTDFGMVRVGPGKSTAVNHVKDSLFN
ncbi:unnamed protein product [Closterium sp. Naga37s-1]|nr:unnamed protein product [Closterium sp. Naga37s-1]